MGCGQIHVMFRELHLMKKLMVILERLVLELYLDVVLEETLICWVLEDYLVIIMIMMTMAMLLVAYLGRAHMQAFLCTGIATSPAPAMQWSRDI